MVRDIKLYDIQQQFIKSAKKCIKEGKTAIFSSPTGTGKTISLLLSIEAHLNKNKSCDYSGLSDRNIELLKEFDFEKTKIFYASRTHSQLNQAIKELKNLEINCDAVVIGSRALYCRHEEIKKLNDIDLINEKCRKARDKDKCVFYTNFKHPTDFETNSQNQTEFEFDSVVFKRKRQEKLQNIDLTVMNSKRNGVLSLSDTKSNSGVNKSEENDILTRISLLEESLPIIKAKPFRNSGIHDIEDLKESECKFCPYYKAKELVKNASIVFLPYQMLFSKESRESFNLDLEDSIIIIDEAHNIYESVIQMNSAMVSYDNLTRYNSAFRKYRQKINSNIVEAENDGKKKFFTKKMNMLDEFLNILHCLLNFCNSASKHTYKEEKVIFVNEFLIKSHLHDFNMLKLKEYIRGSNLVQILEGFETNLQLGLYSIVNFLVLLTNSDSNGIILFDDKKIRFTPLDAKLYFEEIQSCRSLILAGGTMEPLDSLLRIFPKTEIFSYGSVCENFTANILSVSPSGKFLRLTYEQRENMEIMNDLTLTVKNLMNCARNAFEKGNGHGGIVCFVPSKAFLEVIKTIFMKNPDQRLVYHFEDLRAFESDCKVKNTVLFAVMGGRLSEGINFSDDYCRMLFVIGIPFPSLTPEVRERIKFDGQSLLINIAMKTVNQSLGRALRHKNDFASIILIDQRYEQYQKLLSPWIRKKIKIGTFRDTFKQVHDFLQVEIKKGR